MEFGSQLQATDTDDVEPVDRLILVFDGQKDQFEKFIKALKKDGDLSQFEDAAIDLSSLEEKLSEWQDRFFVGSDDHVSKIREDVLSIARHMAKNDRIPPRFFPFSERENHDLDCLATHLLAENVSRVDEELPLQGEYAREDRLWKSLYYKYDLFKSHYNGCVERLLHARRHGFGDEEHEPAFENPEILPDSEPSDETKKEVKARDGKRCLCCGATKRLTIDHIAPRYTGGQHHMDNLQTLCSVCNSLKGDRDCINFRNHRTTLSCAPASLLTFPERMPVGNDAKDRDKWERYLRLCVNFFYRCSAVEQVEIGGRGEKYRHWRIALYQGNPAAWVQPHLDKLAEEIQVARASAGLQASPESIVAVE